METQHQHHGSHHQATPVEHHPASPAPASHEPSDHSHAHDRHEGHSVEMFRRRFWLTLALTIPTLAWSPMIQHWLGFSAPSFAGSRYLPAFLGTLVYLYGGSVFLQGAWRELQDRKPGMMTLIALAITVAFVF